MTTLLRVLIAADSEADAELLENELSQHGYELISERVESSAAMEAALDTLQWDVILSDYSMPGFSASAALELAQSKRIDIPLIIVANSVGEEVAAAVMEAGARDFILKDNLARLVPAIERELHVAEERRERREAEKQLRQAEERFAKTFRAGPAGIVLFRMDERISDVNDEALALLGFDREEVIGRTPTELNIWNEPDDRLKIEALLRERQLAQEFETKCHTKSGETRNLLASFAAIQWGSEERVLALFQDITARKRSDEALRRLQHAVEQSATMLVITDVQGNIEYVNPKFLQVTGYALDEVIGKNPRILKSGETSPEVYKQLWDTITSGQEWRGELQNRRKSGELFWASVSISPVKNAEGHIVNYLEAAEDITERKEAEAELNALYNATSYLFKADSLLNLGHQIVEAVGMEFKQADCCVMLVDREQNRLVPLASAGEYRIDAQALLDISRSGLVDEAVRTGNPAHDSNTSGVADAVPNKTHIQSELVVPLKTSSRVVAVLDLQSSRLHAFNDRDQRILTAFAERAAAAIEILQLYEEINGYASKLEERVTQRTADLQRAKENVETILNNSSDGIVLIDAYGAVQQTNPTFSRMVGVTEIVYGGRLQDYVTSSDREACAVALLRIMQQHQPERVELTCVRGDGTLFDADVVFAPLPGYRDDNQRIVCSLRDISPRKHEEAELRKALTKEKELNEMKSRFVSMVSHEFRTPLASVLSSSELVRTYGDRMPPERQHEHLERIGVEVRRLTELIDDVLTIGRVDNGGAAFNPERLNLETFCRIVVDEFRETATGHEIRYTTNGNCTEVEVDAKLMRQVLNNLLSNAVKYSPKGSVVDVELGCSQDTATLRITDQGIGIPAADQARLFEVFHRARNVRDIPGTGLGLSIVKRAVEAHRGNVAFESEEAKGTTFIVRIPLAPQTGSSRESCSSWSCTPDVSTILNL